MIKNYWNEVESHSSSLAFFDIENYQFLSHIKKLIELSTKWSSKVIGQNFTENEDAIIFLFVALMKYRNFKIVVISAIIHNILNCQWITSEFSS